MSLASRYSKVISLLARSGGDSHKLVAYMRTRGHLGLLPSAVRMAEADLARDTSVTVTVAKAEDAMRFKDHIAGVLKTLGAGSDEYHIVVDEKIVGGTIVTGRGMVIDTSYRTRLVSLYQSVI